jgi:hypothetical protein
VYKTVPSKKMLAKLRPRWRVNNKKKGKNRECFSQVGRVGRKAQNSSGMVGM